MEYKAALQVWQTEVFAVIDDPKSTPGDLARAVGSHGTSAASAAAAAAGGAPAAGSVGGSGSGSGEAEAFAGECWIDTCGDDKRHKTALMRAAEAGRTALVVALVDAHGAGVNVQAERSCFTALHLSAYEGREEVVAALLARGADMTLLNKFGETPLKNAEERLAKRDTAARRNIVAHMRATAALRLEQQQRPGK